mmetsp:Transcript_18754/g.26943  ORF Transcript_18754/g.26943 Transcript_18754/m.26943 type:complete len:264 (+) Transcript_18754:51-842(+)|eukprot:CAMPEP_0202445754 /NCGR_PEP_ID=MMETSP1360-20130828/4501_1 /ASSEMBLY_ACC=CAM_ASM_000848 /TAXON_ID=515479 /ORGANISM="Licmophora paradoxa, Strain CCMP2313" /LENGTH=263 /DNA_ID=CAMNT_0049062115 /DNA_START=25 /DNA_END=816 /DNA_ORIENTATION=-
MTITPDDMSVHQERAYVMAHVMALIGLGLCSYWIHLMGGLASFSAVDESSYVFNWHPLFMMIAFFFITVAVLSWRQPSHTRYSRKVSHGINFSVAVIAMLVALIAVWKSHLDEDSGYVANLYSFHSWVGIWVFIFFTFQWMTALFAYGFGSPEWKVSFMPYHKLFGLWLYQGVALAIMLGIQEKEGFIGCSYTVTEPDLWPTINLFEIPLKCWISHLMGIFVIATVLLVSFALHGVEGRGARPPMPTGEEGDPQPLVPETSLT